MSGNCFVHTGLQNRRLSSLSLFGQNPAPRLSQSAPDRNPRGAASTTPSLKSLNISRFPFHKLHLRVRSSPARPKISISLSLPERSAPGRQPCAATGPSLIYL